MEKQLINIPKFKESEKLEEAKSMILSLGRSLGDKDSLGRDKPFFNIIQIPLSDLIEKLKPYWEKGAVYVIKKVK